MFSWWPFGRGRRSSTPQAPSESDRLLFAGPVEVPFEARLAIYDTFDAPPQMHVIAATDCLSFVNVLTQRILEAAHSRGGRIPIVAIREIVENLLHARFHSIVVTVYPDGNEIVVADQGPGVPDKGAAMRPGFSTASPEMRRFIKGVGSGLLIAHESLRAIGGSLRLEDNIGGGTVVTLRASAEEQPARQRRESREVEHPVQDEVAATEESPRNPASVAGNAVPKGEYKLGRAKSSVSLTPRQQRVLHLLAESGEAGPSTVAERGGISLASAYRDLVALEGLGFAQAIEGGKRKLTDKGRHYLAGLNESK